MRINIKFLLIPLIFISFSSMQAMEQALETSKDYLSKAQSTLERLAQSLDMLSVANGKLCVSDSAQAEFISTVEKLNQHPEILEVLVSLINGSQSPKTVVVKQLLKTPNHQLHAIKASIITLLGCISFFYYMQAISPGLICSISPEYFIAGLGGAGCMLLALLLYHYVHIPTTALERFGHTIADLFATYAPIAYASTIWAKKELAKSSNSLSPAAQVFSKYIAFVSELTPIQRSCLRNKAYLLIGCIYPRIFSQEDLFLTSLSEEQREQLIAHNSAVKQLQL